MIPVAVLLFAAFLSLLAGLAFVGFKLATPKDGKPSGCVPGCALAVGLAFIGTIGLLAFIVLVVSISAGRAVERGVGAASVSIERGRARGLRSGEPLHLRAFVSGKLADWLDRAEIERIVEEACDCECEVSLSDTGAPGGERRLEIDVTLPFDTRDLERLQRELEQHLDELRAELERNGGIGIHFDGETRDY
jgi:hypothetical protein